MRDAACPICGQGGRLSVVTARIDAGLSERSVELVREMCAGCYVQRESRLIKLMTGYRADEVVP